MSNEAELKGQTVVVIGGSAGHRARDRTTRA